MSFKVVVHGGAWAIPDEAVADHKSGVKRACELAASMLQRGASALDAVQAAVEMMEDDPTFDAGRGSFVNSAGEVEMDAVLATDELKIGACCAVRNVRHPVQVARAIMDHTKNVLVVGEGCAKLVEEHKIETCTTESLLVGRELERFYEIKGLPRYDSKTAFAPSSSTARALPLKGNGMGTVGVVCQDQAGRLAVGLSTGGTPFKRPGRVGDTPLWGSGAYVERPHAGAAATGYGEDLIRALFTRSAVDGVRMGQSAQTAARSAVEALGSRVNGFGGLVMLSYEPGYHGIGLAFNTPRMAFAFQTDKDAEATFGIEPSDVAQLTAKQPIRLASKF